MCNITLLHAANWLRDRPSLGPCNAQLAGYLTAAYDQWSALTTTGQVAALEAAEAVLELAKETSA